MKFLVQQKLNTSDDAVGYVNASYDLGRMPLVCAILCYRGGCTPRVARLLVDAGTDTASAVRITDDAGRLTFNGTPLALATAALHHKKVARVKDATQEQLHGFEGVRRLLLRVEAVHAAYLLWPIDNPSFQDAEGKGRTKKIPTPVSLMLPMLRRRASRPKVLLAALFRWVMIFDDRQMLLSAQGM